MAGKPGYDGLIRAIGHGSYLPEARATAAAAGSLALMILLQLYDLCVERASKYGG